MDIKKFNVGDTVFTIVFPPSGRRENAVIQEMRVRKIGSKYLHVAGDMRSYDHSLFHAEPSKPYLVQNLDYGYPMFLFETRKEAEEYVEHAKLQRWFASIRADSLSLGELRSIHELIGGDLPT